MKRIFTIVLTVLCLVGCKTQLPEIDDPMASDKPAYLYVNNLSDYTPYLLLDKDALGLPAKRGKSQMEIFPVFCNKPGRLSVWYNWDKNTTDKLEYVISQNFEFKNGHVYTLTIENYTCKLTGN